VRNSAVNSAQSVSAQGVSAQFLKTVIFRFIYSVILSTPPEQK